jgi:hypothetical protein
LAALAEEGYLRVQGAELDGTWPPAGAHIAVFTTSQGEDARIGPLARFAASAASLVPTLVVAGDPTDLGAVAPLREAGSLPPRLSSFDSAAADPSSLAPGDTVQLEGRREAPYVLATRLVLPGPAHHVVGRCVGVAPGSPVELTTS